MAKQNKSKKKKRPAPQAPAAKPAQTAPAPDHPPRTAKLMAALCYLNVLILIPACTKWRHDEFVKFHLNQGLKSPLPGIWRITRAFHPFN